MKRVVIRVARQTPISLNEVDITSDPELEALYGTEIPVLLIDGKKAAKYRLSDDELIRIVRSRAG